MEQNQFSSNSNNKKKIILWIIIGLILIVGLWIIYKMVFVSIPVGDSEEDNCLMDSFNCDDFVTQIEAQEVFDECGGLDNDIHQLDKDGNGLACESLN